MLEPKTKILIIVISLSLWSMHLSSQVDSIAKVYKPLSFELLLQQHLGAGTIRPLPPESLMTIKPSSMPLFCHIEHTLEVKSRIPVRFRLGSLDYVNTLEGKK